MIDFVGILEKMQQGLDAMQTALRVLKAITERRSPDQADVDKLRSLDPLSADLPVDELACDVIRNGLKRWESRRAEAATSNE